MGIEKKAKINYFIDLFMGIFFVIVSLTSFVLLFFLHSGVSQRGYRTFLGLLRQTWTDIHIISGMIFIIFGLIHLLLHWDWFVCMTKGIFSKKN